MKLVPISFLFFNLISLAFRMSKLDFLNSLPNLI
ncbi:hypothetical protein SPYJRS4_0037 [Streptococcus pyogenes JRS4]|nr:hypothetical protein SPYJRS4_0037 [Streptococcus pyogenes JRS4]